MVTPEPYTNIEKAERYDKSLIANIPVTYTFKAPELGIYEIAVTGKENENNIALRVEALKGTSKLVTVQAPGIVYKNVNIWAGTKRIKEVLIRFKIENSWLSSNSLAGSDIKMVKWDGSKWVQLETAEKTKDSAYTYYEAKTDTFSHFAITGAKGGFVAPTATPLSEVTATPGKAYSNCNSSSAYSFREAACMAVCINRNCGYSHSGCGLYVHYQEKRLKEGERLQTTMRPVGGTPLPKPIQTVF